MRSFSRFSAVAALTFGLVALGATEARAGLGDIIWGMSGPQMVGGVLRCRVPVSGGATKCSIVGIPVRGNLDTMSEDRRWISWEGAIYRSTGKNGDGIDFKPWQTEMVSMDPVFEFTSGTAGIVRFYHGVGGTFAILAGPDFRRFGKAGFKLRPVGLEIGEHVEVAFNLRFYPDGFGADQFGLGPKPTGDRPFETTWGFLVGYKYGRR